MKLLKEISTIGSGQNAPQNENYYLNGTYSFIKASNMDDIIEDDSENRASKVTDEAIRDCKLKLFSDNSIIFAKSGLSCVKNRVYLTKKPSYIVNHLCVVSDISNSYDPTWLSYFIKAYDVTKLIKDDAYPSISLKDIGSIQVPDVNLKEQYSEVKSLNFIADALRNKKNELNNLYSLIKSRFIEMFGSYDLSEEHDDWKSLKELGDIYTGTTPSTKDEGNWDGVILWITPAEMNDNSFYIYDTERKITEKGRASKSLNLMPINTVLLSTRAPIGKVGIVGKPMTCNQGFKNFYCPNYLNPVYLYHLLKMNNEYLNSLGRGTTFKEVSKTICGNIKIPVPLLEKQNEFASFVELIDKSKFIVQKQIKDLQELLDKKMDEYFGQE